MTNLAQASSLFKKLAVFSLFLFTVLGLLLLIYLRAKGNTAPAPSLASLAKPQIQTLPHGIRQIQSSSMKIVGQQPQQASIYSIKPSEGLLGRADTIAAKFNLSGAKIL